MPSVNPRIKFFWTKKMKMRVGNMATVPSAEENPDVIVPTMLSFTGDV